MARMIHSARNAWVVRIRPIVANMSERPALLGGAAARSFQTATYVPEEADIVQEQMGRHLVPGAGDLGGLLVLASLGRGTGRGNRVVGLGRN